MGLQNKGSRLEEIAFGVVFFIICHDVLAGSQSDIAQMPLSLSTGVPANLIFTLDDSESMARAYIPDTTTATYAQLIDASAATDSRRFRAGNTNLMYYNPHIIYQIPPALHKSGEEYSLITSFTQAPFNGFAANNIQGKVNLSNSYRVLKEQQLPDGAVQYAEHPSADFSCSIDGFVSNGTRMCDGQVKFAITRTSDSTCTAKAFLADIEQAAECLITDHTATARVRDDMGVPAYYYEFDGSLNNAQCDAGKNNQDAGGEECYRLRWVDQASVYDKSGNGLNHPNGSLVDGRENFAIWYSFYKTRALAALSATSMAFQQLPADVRFTWQSLHACKDFTGSDTANCQSNAIKTYSKTHKGQFYSWLRQVTFNADASLSEAMIRAGQYLKTAAPWQKYFFGPTRRLLPCRMENNTQLYDLTLIVNLKL